MKNPLNRKIQIETKEIDGEQWIKFNKKFDRLRYFQGNAVALLMLIVLVVALVLLFAKVFPYLKLLRMNPCGLCEDLGYMCTALYTG